MSGGQWEKTIGLADMHGTVARVIHTPADSEGDAITQVALTCGGARIDFAPTPEALRQLAAAFLDGADAMEGS